MERCEGYYRLENRRCDREGSTTVTATDGDAYLVCDYHARRSWVAGCTEGQGRALYRSRDGNHRPVHLVGHGGLTLAGA